MEDGLTATSAAPAYATPDRDAETDHVAELVTLFEEADDATREARERAERDRDYYDGKQWTATAESALRKRGQPVVTFNRIQRKVNFLKGLEAQTRKDPKAFPRTPDDDGAAQAATDALRFVCEANDWDQIRSDAFEAIIVEGTGAVMIGARDGRDGIDPAITAIPWDRFWYDPHSRRADFSDAAYMGIVTWMDVDDARARWPEAAEIIDETLTAARSSETYDDRPKFQMWADHKRKRIRIIEAYYKRDGRWMACTFTKSGHLIAPAPSPYLCEDRRPDNPIRAISAYVDRDNNRYGEVRAMISPQDEVNKRRSKGLHLINSRQMRISRAAQIEASVAKRELAKPDGVLIADNGEIEILPTGDLAAANFQMLQEAKAEIDLLGPNAALAGKNEEESSGRAILAQQQGGMVEVALLMDRLRMLSLAVYRACWARIRQYWNAPRWIRVTDDARSPRFIGINQPRTMLEVAQERLAGDPSAPAKLALLARDPAAQQVMRIANQVSELDVDIVIDEGMDTPTVQSEQFDTLVKLAPGLVNLPVPVIEIIIQASSLRDKDKLLEIVRQIGAEQTGPQAQLGEAIARQVALRRTAAEIQKIESETAKNAADAEARRAGEAPDLMRAEARALEEARLAGEY
jgi:hypothetical protein